MDCLSTVLSLAVSPDNSCVLKSHFSSQLFARRCKFSSPGIRLYRRAAIQSVVYASRFSGLENYIDEGDYDECAMAALVLRSGFTKSTRPFKGGYHCDLDHIGERLKAFEKESVDLGGFFNTEKRVFPFFPEDIPEMKVVKPPPYALNINKALFSVYVSHILPSVTSKIYVKPSTSTTYRYDILLLQCLSTAIYAGIDIGEKAYKSNSSMFDRAVSANDKEQVFELISNLYCEKSLKQRLKFLEKKLVKKVRRVKVERLPKHYVLTDFYLDFVQKEKKLLGVEHIMSKL